MTRRLIGVEEYEAYLREYDPAGYMHRLRIAGCMTVSEENVDIPYDGDGFFWSNMVMGEKWKLVVNPNHDIRVRAVYIVVDRFGKVAYVGKTERSVRSRLTQHMRNWWFKQAFYISEAKGLPMVDELERALIKALQPHANRQRYAGSRVDPVACMRMYGMRPELSATLTRRLSLEAMAA